MTLMQGAKVLKTYKVALSRKPVGAKEHEGDHKVPEGEYMVDSKNSHSRFHLALHISYPNATDREKARKLGVRPIPGKRFTPQEAAELVDQWLKQTNVCLLAAGDQHSLLMSQLMISGHARGSLVADPHLAASTMEYGGIQHTTRPFPWIALCQSAAIGDWVKVQRADPSLPCPPRKLDSGAPRNLSARGFSDLRPAKMVPYRKPRW